MTDLRRLERARALLGPAEAKLLLVSIGGFDRALRDEADRRPDVELVDLERLYEGE